MLGESLAAAILGVRGDLWCDGVHSVHGVTLPVGQKIRLGRQRTGGEVLWRDTMHGWHTK